MRRRRRRSGGKSADGSTAILDGIGSATHYAVQGDIVARLGGGHLGSNGQVIYLPWQYFGGSSLGKPMNLTDAHRIETAFCTHLDHTGEQLTGGLYRPEQGFMLGGQDAVNWAGAIGSLLNDEKVAPSEALFRLIAGMGGASILASPSELDEVLQAAVETQYDAAWQLAARRTPSSALANYCFWHI